MPAKTQIYIYYVFTPKYRKKLLVDAVKDSIQWALKD
jgi:REP element-mobilizing transposase RayT